MLIKKKKSKGDVHSVLEFSAEISMAYAQHNPRLLPVPKQICRIRFCDVSHEPALFQGQGVQCPQTRWEKKKKGVFSLSDSASVVLVGSYEPYFLEGAYPLQFPLITNTEHNLKVLWQVHWKRLSSITTCEQLTEHLRSLVFIISNCERLVKFRSLKIAFPFIDNFSFSFTPLFAKGRSPFNVGL